MGTQMKKTNKYMSLAAVTLAFFIYLFEPVHLEPL